jgi:predicted MPP superfamily phosphohydrolase
VADRPAAAGGGLRLPTALAAGCAVCAGVAVYATVVERHWFALRRAVAPVLEPGSKPLRVLHLSDLHLVPRQRRKARWVSGLARLHPDLVVLTGDTLAAADAVGPAIAALGPLLDLPGAFVFGNNDFYAPEPKSPHRYFTRRTHVRRKVDLPWPDLRDALTDRGWADVNNARAAVTVRSGPTVALAGVNDPHTGRDRYGLIEGPAREDAAVRIGVTHSPEPRLLDKFAADGYELILAGHTHGGQVRLPGFGAVVTNCGIDRSRARGLSRWGASSWLNVSAGLGNSPYMPVRFCCRPEATLLTLVGRRPATLGNRSTMRRQIPVAAAFAQVAPSRFVSGVAFST